MSIQVQPSGAVYKAAPGASFTDAQAERYGTFLAREVGLGTAPVTPDEIVAAARPRSSPIHEAFTWDDSEAARHWRISEARHLVAHVLVSVETPEGDTASSRAFHNVVAVDDDGEPHRGYVAAAVVWQRPDLAEQVVAKALHELRGWRNRYAAYADLAGAVAAVDEALESNGG